MATRLSEFKKLFGFGKQTDTSTWNARRLDAILRKAEDAIWDAVTGDSEGDVGKVLEDLMQKLPGAYMQNRWGALARKETYAQNIPGVNFPKFLEGYQEYLGKLVNLCRPLTQEEIERVEGLEEDMDEGEYSILFIAICRGWHKDVEYLLRRPEIALGIQCGSHRRTTLFEAVRRESDALVSKILECPFVSPSQHIDIGDADENTPLHQVALNMGSDERKPSTENSNVKSFNALLLHGANIDAFNNQFRTPLHILANYRPPSKEAAKCAKELLEAGAEVNPKDENGRSLVHFLSTESNLANRFVEFGRGIAVTCCL